MMTLARDSTSERCSSERELRTSRRGTLTVRCPARAPPSRMARRVSTARGRAASPGALETLARRANGLVAAGWAGAAAGALAAFCAGACGALTAAGAPAPSLGRDAAAFVRGRGGAARLANGELASGMSARPVTGGSRHPQTASGALPPTSPRTHQERATALQGVLRMIPTPNRRPEEASDAPPPGTRRPRISARRPRAMTTAALRRGDGLREGP